MYPIILREYTSSYVQKYCEEEKFLLNLFGEAVLRINHIGSTAVPELISKPTIDILLEIKKSTDLTAITESLAQAGYIVNRPAKYIITYIKGYGATGFEGQTYHIHVREYADRDELYFRDYLIAHPQISKEYGELKQKLQKNFEHDRDGYTGAKGKFVSRIKKLARVELKDKYNPVK